MNGDVWIVGEYYGRLCLRPMNHANCESLAHTTAEYRAHDVMIVAPNGMKKGDTANINSLAISWWSKLTYLQHAWVCKQWPKEKNKGHKGILNFWFHFRRLSGGNYGILPLVQHLDHVNSINNNA